MDSGGSSMQTLSHTIILPSLDVPAYVQVINYLRYIILIVDRIVDMIHYHCKQGLKFLLSML